MDKEYYRLIAHNKKASHEYFFEELYEAGIAFSIIGVVNNSDGPYLSDGDTRTVMEDGIY